LLLLNEVGVLGVFTSLDFFLLYIFWEIVLIHMFFLIGSWGGPRKDYAAIKFFIYPANVYGVRQNIQIDAVC
jgi:NADH-quinone oxidoreductase subunit M